MSKIIIDKIDFAYNRNNPIFSNLSATLGIVDDSGFIEVIMSPSGVGKTTLLKLILGIEEPNNGTITVDPNIRLGYVPQDPVLLEHLSPMQNATYFSVLYKLKDYYNQNLFQELLSTLEMQDVLSNSNNTRQLSGGEKQRLSLLRAMSVSPKILLLDEPCTGLDAERKIAFLEKLCEIVYTQKILLIYITHHIDEAKLIGDRISYLLKKDIGVSEIIQQSPNDFILTPPTIEASYLCAFPLKMTLAVNYIDKIISLSGSSNYIYITIDNLIPCESDNADFSVTNGNSLYMTLKGSKYPEKTIITMSNKENQKFFRLSGNIALYDIDGRFMKIINIQNNE